MRYAAALPLKAGRSSLVFALQSSDPTEALDGPFSNQEHESVDHVTLHFPCGRVLYVAAPLNSGFSFGKHQFYTLDFS